MITLVGQHLLACLAKQYAYCLLANRIVAQVRDGHALTASTT